MSDRAVFDQQTPGRLPRCQHTGPLHTHVPVHSPCHLRRPPLQQRDPSPASCFTRKRPRQRARARRTTGDKTRPSMPLRITPNAALSTHAVLRSARGGARHVQACRGARVTRLVTRGQPRAPETRGDHCVCGIGRLLVSASGGARAARKEKDGVSKCASELS
jgi:hypothetical protein